MFTTVPEADALPWDDVRGQLVAHLGPPRDVLAWHAAGDAGRDGFRRVGRWHFE